MNTTALRPKQRKRLERKEKKEGMAETRSNNFLVLFSWMDVMSLTKKSIHNLPSK